ncbi:hypothetical protein [Nocardia wallacei]|uniref:hypothetical protein n=1 Tax=Nocardia wallacei TaxID=480035 RepID=UPI0024539EDC|nr:hypothetical protein [Nocardia wallacei]
MLPPEVAAVVARWNPQGSALLESVPVSGAPEVAHSVPVALIGPADTNTTLLRTELARFEPHIDLSEPQTDPAVLVAPPPVALVLIDAGTTLGAALLDLVGRLRTGGTRIVFAMNGIHAHPDWRTDFERNRALLVPVLGADPDLVAVSARLAVAARGSGDAALLDRSGLGALHAYLTRAVGAGGEGRAAAIIAQVLGETRRRIRAQAETLRSGASVTQLREERATLLAARDGGRAQAMAALRNRLHLARVDLLHDVGARIRALNAAARTDVERLARRSARAYPDDLQQSVNQLTVELDAVVEQRLAELTRQLESGGPAAESAREPVRSRSDPPPRLGPDLEPRHRGLEDTLMIALGASAGFGLGRLVVAPLALVPELDYATVPVTLALGGGVAYWVVRARGHLADRAHLRQWVSDALVNVKAQLEQRVATALVEAESRLTDQVVRATTVRVLETDRRVAELERQLRELSAQQPAQVAACERDLAVIDKAFPE